MGLFKKEAVGSTDLSTGFISAGANDRMPQTARNSTDKLSNALKTSLHTKLNNHLDPCKLDKVERQVARAQVRQVLETLMDQEKATLSADERNTLLDEVTNEVFALGPIEPLLSDTTIDDILVNRCDQVYIERGGKLFKTEVRFKSDEHLCLIIHRIVARVGRQIDENSPMVDARLPDGSRVNAVIQPVTLRGSTLSIRKFRPIPFTPEDFISMGSCTPDIIKLLQLLVRGRFNILISGGTGSGKTTLLNMISTQIPEGERIVTIEDAAELQLAQDHVVSMETRPQVDGGKTEVNQRMLVKNALRMRPDRIIIGEVRGVEALDMLQAMNTGHDGSLTTIHANSPRDAISRLELMMLYGGINLPHVAMLRMITAAIHVIVQLKRYSDGVRRVAQLTEITGMEGDIVTLHDIAYFKEEGFDASGQVRGKFVMSHMQPNFVEKLRGKGLV